MSEFINVRVGAHVWLGNSYGKQKLIGEVVKLTPIMFDVQIDNGQAVYTERFYKKDGYRVGRSWNSEHVTDYALSIDVENYRAKIADEKKRRKDSEDENARREALLKKLTAEFARENTEVSSSFNRELFVVSFYNLTEAQVRRLAVLTRGVIV